MEPPTPAPASLPESAPQHTSLLSRLFNVFAAPGEVFDEVRDAPAPANANWLVPALVFIVVGWIGSALILSQDSIRHQISEMTERAIQKQVEKSQMSQEQAEHVLQMAEKWTQISTTAGAYGGTLLVAFASPFWWGLILWLAGSKIHKGGFGYMKAVEVAGLGSMITVLDSVLRTLLILATGNLFTAPSLALLVKEFDPQNTQHNLLALVNVMTFWSLAIRALGLARLARVSFALGAVWVFGLWGGWKAASIGVGLGFKAAFGG